jgi:hypothetical protein
VAEESIGLFKALRTNEYWLDGDFSSLVRKRLPEFEFSEITLVDNPASCTEAIRIGEISVKSVDDETVYQVKRIDDDLNELHIDRVPDGNAGEWAVQALIFNKNFDDETARKWLADRDYYEDSGDNDETSGISKFLQFDHKYFDSFQVVAVDKGVDAVYAQIAEEENEKGQEDFVAAYETHKTVQVMNRLIASKGLSLLAQSREVNITKGDTEETEETEERYILGIVLEPTIVVDDEGNEIIEPDTQDDVYTAETIRAAAHGWMENYGLIDLMHNWTALSKENVRVIESYIAPCDFSIGDGVDSYLVKKGTWLLALRVVHDELWKAIGEGDIGAFSIGGVATRTPLDEQQAAEA